MKPSTRKRRVLLLTASVLGAAAMTAASSPAAAFSGSNHIEMNKDSSVRPGFWAARSDAILAVQQQIRLFKVAVIGKYPSESGTIFNFLGLRTQPRVVDDAVVMWPLSKRVYFFQGSTYKRYDLVTDTVDPGYPSAIVPAWIGLNAFSAGIDAAFAGASSKAFFFKGNQYIRYNLGGNGTAEGADPGFPAAISSKWTGVFSSGFDAAVPFPNGKIYFFKDGSYTRYTPGASDTSAGQADAGYPRSITGNWPGLEPFSAGIDAVFISPVNSKAYFFKAGYYIRYDVNADSADPGYPLPIADYWPGI